jgi:hypothetical protein
MEAAAARLRAVYERMDAADRFRATFYDAPHQFNAAMQDEAFAWLERWLKA